jgi:PAS domain S-box-containing protein
VFVEISTYPIGQGDKAEVIGIARDITERRQIEKALRQSEERFRSVLDNSLDMIYSMNLQNGRYEYVSPSSKKMLGYSPEEFVALGSDELISLVHPDDAEELQQNIVDLITRGENRAVSAEYRVKHKELDYRWVSDNRSVVCDDENMPVAIVGSLRDITERKNAEAKLKQTMAELTRSNTELEQFAYVASHDLQEPLRMVASYTQLLGRRYKGKLDADADEFIGYAVDGATRMQSLINDLLAYSRVGTRGKPFEPTNCEDVFNNAITNLRVAIEEHAAVVTHERLPTVLADMTQMVQLFQNLIGNAIKFHSDRRPEVHVEARRNDAEWLFSVRDNGIGIAPEHYERIFVIFQRLHGREEYPGTGIGLAVCKRIVERHKGRIWVESEVGKGSTFYFTIPVAGDK